MRRWATAAVAVAALGVAGCGSAAPSGPAGSATMGSQAGAAMKTATSVHMSGNVTDKGQHMTLNLSITRSGDMDGQVSVNGQSYTILVTGGHAYVQLDADFLKLAHLPSSLCATYCGKYIAAPASSVSSLTNGSLWSNFVTGFTGNAKNLTYGGVSTVDGQSVWKVAGNNSTDSVYLSAAAPHLPVRVVHRNQHIDFTQWNTVTIPAAPTGKNLVNPANL